MKQNFIYSTLLNMCKFVSLKKIQIIHRCHIYWDLEVIALFMDPHPRELDVTKFLTSLSFCKSSIRASQISQKGRN